MTEDIVNIVRRAAERGLPSLIVGGNALILLGYTRNTTGFRSPRAGREKV